MVCQWWMNVYAVVSVADPVLFAAFRCGGGLWQWRSKDDSHRDRNEWCFVCAPYCIQIGVWVRAGQRRRRNEERKLPFVDFSTLCTCNDWRKSTWKHWKACGSKFWQLKPTACASLSRNLTMKHCSKHCCGWMLSLKWGFQLSLSLSMEWLTQRTKFLDKISVI